MTDNEKIKAIEDMGVDWKADCPTHHNFKYLPQNDYCSLQFNSDICGRCWIKALEDKP